MLGLSLRLSSRKRGVWKVLYENQIEALASTVTELRTVGNVKLDCRLKCFKVKLKILLVKNVCKYCKLLKWKAVFAKNEKRESVRSLRIFAYVIYRILIVWLKWYWCFTRTLDFYHACCAVGRMTRSTVTIQRGQVNPARSQTRIFPMGRVCLKLTFLHCVL